MGWKWTCDICQKQFKTSQGLFLHKRLAHQMTVEQARRNPLVQVWLCEICEFKTYYASSYYRHMRFIHAIEPLEEESSQAQGEKGNARMSTPEQEGNPVIRDYPYWGKVKSRTFRQFYNEE